MTKRKHPHLRFEMILNRTRSLSLILLLAMCTAIFLSSSLLPSTVSANNEKAWRLTWSDEFNGSTGATPDSTKWSFDIGGGGWGNNELQTYTARSANARLEGGSLAIR